ncbi:hypothetical protein K470DRAFT_260624 [Piedraia hortae CBS 480.64]|uniref:Uncharacterized protein n=1 Tax=Piedraia hortae CBS 480.64 TaxID=1314780 RepID=A0A6A7BR04_9PEZI|nr:hypothetical protein K470DRAFT_260624 [Piedraia hortae CBS 480.64]
MATTVRGSLRNIISAPTKYNVCTAKSLLQGRDQTSEDDHNTCCDHGKIAVETPSLPECLLFYGVETTLISQSSFETSTSTATWHRDQRFQGPDSHSTVFSDRSSGSNAQQPTKASSSRASFTISKGRCGQPQHHAPRSNISIALLCHRFLSPEQRRTEGHIPDSSSTCCMSATTL